MKTLAQNKKATFDYEISDKRQAGIVLSGHEVKACKLDHCSITEAIINLNTLSGELTIKGMNIPLYSKANIEQLGSYEPKRDRTLLVNARERTRIAAKISQGGGATIIPLKVVELRNRKIKIIMGLAKRRRKVEKRHIIKERDISRQMKKEISNLGL